VREPQIAGKRRRGCRRPVPCRCAPGGAALVSLVALLCLMETANLRGFLSAPLIIAATLRLSAGFL